MGRAWLDLVGEILTSFAFPAARKGFKILEARGGKMRTEEPLDRVKLDVPALLAHVHFWSSSPE